ncbi:DoxX family protein [Paraflavitalea soli]|uniref:DoxX family protein n=1 Tax=Paraflavitalea soli TaxID=2315862 RepID=A0A3B7MNR7_9BACT|nr:DoxX family protein [Paraflavitalea soli]AXY74616.1 DoxX family protein [Paraflavitalea soli]
MRYVKISYWATTALVSLMMVYSSIVYFIDSDLKQAFLHLGLPDYFRIELSIAKLLGVALLLLPVYGWLKEWAYAGFFIVFISAIIAHTASGDPLMVRMMPLIFLFLLLISYFCYRLLHYSPPADV